MKELADTGMGFMMDSYLFDLGCYSKFMKWIQIYSLLTLCIHSHSMGFIVVMIQNYKRFGSYKMTRVFENIDSIHFN